MTVTVEKEVLIERFKQAVASINVSLYSKPELKKLAKGVECAKTTNEIVEAIAFQMTIGFTVADTEIKELTARVHELEEQRTKYERQHRQRR